MTPVYRKCKKNLITTEGQVLREGDEYCTDAQLICTEGKTLVQVWTGYIFKVPVEEYFEPHGADQWDNSTFVI